LRVVIPYKYAGWGGEIREEVLRGIDERGGGWGVGGCQMSWERDDDKGVEQLPNMKLPNNNSHSIFKHSPEAENYIYMDMCMRLMMYLELSVNR
jgi:hypothetical protein